MPKTAAQTTGGNAWNERIVPVKKGDTVASILRDLGATPEEIRSIASALGPRGRDGGIKEGQKLRVLLSPTGANKRNQAIRIIVANDNGRGGGGRALRHREIRRGRRAERGRSGRRYEPER